MPASVVAAVPAPLTRAGRLQGRARWLSRRRWLAPRRWLWAAALTAAGTASADGLDASLGVVSNQFVRGITATEDHAAVLADLAWRADTGWSAALELAHARGDSEPRLDNATLSLQRGWQLDADWSAQLGYARYVYLGAERRRNYDRDELAATAAWQGRWTATVALSPNMFDIDADGTHHRWTTAYELGWRARWIGRLAADAGVGYQTLQGVGGKGRSYGSAGLSWGLGPVQASLTRIVRQAAPVFTRPSDPRASWAAALFWSF